MRHPLFIDRLWSRPAAGLLVLLLWVTLGAAERKAFDIPAGTADRTLKQFLAQSGAEVVYAAAVVRGVRTPAVKGNLTAAEAIDQLLSGNPLAVRQEPRSSAFMISRDPNGERAGAAPALRPARPPQPGERTEPETIELSPKDSPVNGTSARFPGEA